MRWIQILDLKNKLVLLSAVSGAMALLMASTGFVWHDLRALKTAQIEELRAHAEILALTSAESIATQRSVDEDALAAILRPHGTIASAVLFDDQGRSIADYPHHYDRTLSLPDAHFSHRYTRVGELELFQPIYLNGREVGVVYLKANMREFDEQVRSHAILILTVTLCSLAVALIFGSMVQSLISRPILQLADAARTITTSDDYTVRVSTDSQDELGVLFGSFNQMVEKIQTSQAELKQARDQLEDRVELRTRELQDEIQRREQIQQELVRAKEAAEAASEAKSRFLANISHEIRTPLNAILGFTDFISLHDHQLREADRLDYLKSIKTSGEGLLGLINDILDLSKIEAGQMEYEQLSFHPDSVIADAIAILRPKARERKLILESYWIGAVPHLIQSDPVRLRQVLVNLIGNAIKFTERGSISVVARLDDQTRQLRISVIDTGIGISAKTQESLFEPFIQGDSSVTRRFGGTGLGLSICRSIVQGLGGEIQVDSEPDRGSTFSFAIDAGPVGQIATSLTESMNVLADASNRTPSVSLAAQRILVADDGETNRKLIELVLTQAGAEVILVEDGMAAVSAARAFEFDLIVLDMQMPVMDGYSAATHLRAEGFQKPIVAFTADAMRGDEDRCRKAGCSDYLTKPIRQEFLLARIASLLTGTDVLIGEPSIATGPSSNSGPLISELPIDDLPFAELVCEFIERAHEKMAELHAAQSEADFERMAKLAHWIKGSGGMAGFPSMTDTARTLEHAIRVRDIPGIQAGMTAVAAVVDRLQSPALQPA